MLINIAAVMVIIYIVLKLAGPAVTAQAVQTAARAGGVVARIVAALFIVGGLSLCVGIITGTFH